MTSQDKGTRIILHLSALFVPFLGPLIIYFVQNDALTKKLAVQAMIFNAIMWVCIVVSTFFSWFIIGIPFLIFFGIVEIAVPIIGAIKTMNDEVYQYPIVKHFI